MVVAFVFTFFLANKMGPGSDLRIPLSEWVWLIRILLIFVLVPPGIISELFEERYKTLERLKEINESLERRVRERTEELETALTELQAGQQRLIQSEKMTSLGRLIAGIAHELNSPLGAIRSSLRLIGESLNKNLARLPEFFEKLSSDKKRLFLELLDESLEQKQGASLREQRKYRKELKRGFAEEFKAQAEVFAEYFVTMRIYTGVDKYYTLLEGEQGEETLKMAYELSNLRRSADIADMAGERAARIVFALKNFSRFNSAEELQTYSLVDNLEMVLTLYQNQLKGEVEIIRSYECRPKISCYPDELGQVWSNLVHNALQAMEGRGKLEIRIQKKLREIHVSFIDNGPGIAPEIRKKIFEPFYTTKPTGEGSGLGLDIASRVIEKHKGKILLESEPGRTKFTAVLPASE